MIKQQTNIMNFSKKNHELPKANRIDVSKIASFPLLGNRRFNETFMSFILKSALNVRRTKGIIITALLLLFAISSFAQQGINYKALIKDGSGNVIANDLIQVQFTILQGVGLANVYQETHTPTTDANGIIILNIGEGSVVSGDFDTIDWASSDTHSLKTEINTGAGLTDIGTTQFMHVPKSYYSEQSAQSEQSIFSEQSEKIVIYESGTSNPNKMIIQHSLQYPDWGIRYDDISDNISFVAGDIKNFSIDLATGNATTEGTIEIKSNTSTPSENVIYGNSVPIAYGSIDSLGGISTNYGITSANNSATGVYNIVINLDTNSSNTIVMITPLTSGFGTPEICGYQPTSTNSFTVRIQDVNGVARDSAFAFVVYGIGN